MAVHVHSEGGGATHFMLGCIEDAEKITGNKDQRNVLAHLHFVTDEDVPCLHRHAHDAQNGTNDEARF